MGLFTWIVVGIIAGWLASQLVKGHGMGLLGDIVVGVVGALLGGWLAGTFLHIANPISGFNLTTLLVALGGSVVLLLLLRLFRR